MYTNYIDISYLKYNDNKIKLSLFSKLSNQAKENSYENGKSQPLTQKLVFIWHIPQSPLEGQNFLSITQS